MKKKQIRIQTWSPIGVYPVDELSVDIWISYHNKRKIVYEGPCVIGISSILGEIECAERCIQESKQNELEIFEEQKRKSQEILEKCKNDGIVIEEYDDRCPNIYINEEVNRKTVERALSIYLRRKGFKNEFSFRWNKPKCFVRSMN